MLETGLKYSFVHYARFEEDFLINCLCVLENDGFGLIVEVEA